ncbi:MAG: metallophosphoesterase [Candidatus Woesearchaeota archaeon]
MEQPSPFPTVDETTLKTLVQFLLKKGLFLHPELKSALLTKPLTLDHYQENAMQQPASASLVLSKELQDAITEFFLLHQLPFSIPQQPTTPPFSSSAPHGSSQVSSKPNSANLHSSQVLGSASTSLPSLSAALSSQRSAPSNLLFNSTKASLQHSFSQTEPQDSQHSFSEHSSRLPPLTILFNYTQPPSKKEVSDFVAYFNDRYVKIKSMLLYRQELVGLTSLRNILKKKDNEAVSCIVMVKEITTTKNGNLLLEVEDPTGVGKVVISKAKPDLFSQAQYLVHDEVVGIVGYAGQNVIFCSNLVFPDTPHLHEYPRSPQESYALFLGDLHVGAKHFLHEPFHKLMQWIAGNYGNAQQRHLAKKLEYIFFMGDNVEGVGIYPSQFEDLAVADIYQQYERFEEIVLSIPSSKRILIIPGNHDASRLSEPQPPLDQQFFKRLSHLPHVTFLSSPSVVKIGETPSFAGFTVLLYHGYSFPYYADTISEIRNTGGLERVDKIMSLLLQKRHLAPAHTSTLYIPGPTDHLVINQVPDIFASGHVHRTTIATYRSTILINASCWVDETDYQRKVGLKPQPARAVLVGLHDRQAKILNFE